MIKDTEKMFSEIADIVVPGWRERNVNDLCNDYLDSDDTKREGLLPAIMLNYWPRLHALYKKSYPYVTMEECYDWIADAVMKALDEAAWRNPNSSIYNDPYGPDKAINMIIKCVRSNFFSALNSDKRKIAICSVSYDEMVEKCGDIEFLLPPSGVEFVNFYEDETTETNLIIQYFTNKEYLMSFMLDMIIYQNAITVKDIVASLKGMDVKYSEYFSEKYKFSQETVLAGINYEIKYSKKDLETRVDEAMKTLRRVLKDLKYFEEDGGED